MTFFFPRPQWQINWAAPPARWPRPNWCPQIFMVCCDETIPTDINDIPLDIPHVNQEWDIPHIYIYIRIIYIYIIYTYTSYYVYIKVYICFMISWSFHGHFMVICGYGHFPWISPWPGPEVRGFSALVRLDYYEPRLVHGALSWGVVEKARRSHKYP